MLYTILKLLHIFAVVAWVGGAHATSIITLFLLRARDRTVLAGAFPHIARYASMGGRIAGPVLLVTGIWMVKAAGMNFGAAWISAGFAGVVVIGIWGGVVLRKRADALVAALGSGDDARIAAAGASFRGAGVIDLLMMAAVVAVMVIKPGA